MKKIASYSPFFLGERGWGIEGIIRIIKIVKKFAFLITSQECKKNLTTFKKSLVWCFE